MLSLVSALIAGNNELLLFDEDSILDFSTDSLVLIGEKASKFHEGIQTTTGYVGDKLHHQLMARHYKALINLSPNSTEKLCWFNNISSALESLIPEQDYKSILVEEGLA